MKIALTGGSGRIGQGITTAALAQGQAEVRTRILRAFAARALIERFKAREMLAFKHSGFSVNAGVRIEAQDRAGLERRQAGRPGAQPACADGAHRRPGATGAHAP
jgi:hypothetical protein